MCVYVCVLLQCTHFFFLMEGEVKLERGGVSLGVLGEGSFVVRGLVPPVTGLRPGLFWQFSPACPLSLSLWKTPRIG